MSPVDADGTEDRTADDGCPGPEFSGSGLIATSGEVAKTPARRPALGTAEGYRRPQTAEDRRTAGDRRQKTAERQKTAAWLPGSFLGIRALFQLRTKLQRRRPGGRRWTPQMDTADGHTDGHRRWATQMGTTSAVG